MNNTFPVYSNFDRTIWERELEGFVPERVIDAHTHIWNEAYALDHADSSKSILRLNVSVSELHNWSRTIFPGRKLGYIALPTPLPDIDMVGHNEWIAREVSRSTDPGFAWGEGVEAPLLVKAGMLIHPDFTADYVVSHVRRWGLKVLKPYRAFAKNPANARIRDFFPESIMEAANELGLVVVLHLSKMGGPADEDNIHDLQMYTSSFPNIRWQLAHCVRGFNPVHLEESVQCYADMDTVWVDTSAVNDAYAHYLIFRYFDRKRIVFGSDNVAAGSYRGKYITFGNGWKAFSEKGSLEHCDSSCTFVIYEQLRSQKQAAIMAGLSSTEIQAVFYDNAITLLES